VEGLHGGVPFAVVLLHVLSIGHKRKTNAARVGALRKHFGHGTERHRKVGPAGREVVPLHELLQRHFLRGGIVGDNQDSGSDSASVDGNRAKSSPSIRGHFFKVPHNRGTFIDLSIPNDLGDKVVAQQLVFVVDISGSMSGQAERQVRAVLTEIEKAAKSNTLVRIQGEFTDIELLRMRVL